MTANSSNDRWAASPARLRAGFLPGALLLLAWLTVFQPSARAQLGASPEEVAKVYGPLFRRNARIWHRQLCEGSPLDGDIFQRDGLFVRAVFRAGKVVLLEFTKVTDVLKQADVDLFLANNSDQSQWEMGKDSTLEAKFYHRQDGKAIAQWAIGFEGSLLISAEQGGRLENQLMQ